MQPTDARIELRSDTADALALVHAWGRAFNHRDLARMLALSAPDIELATPQHADRGHDAVRRLLHLQSYGVAQHIRAQRYIARGATVIVEAVIELRWVDSGGLADTMRGVAVFDVQDDRISRFRPLPDLDAAFRVAGWTGHPESDEGRHSSTQPSSV
jgi:limonene-1,2-epoxide hydrolase